MTLLLLTLAASAMSGLCLRSLRLANASIRAQEELQCRWGKVSCRSSLLPAAKHLLDVEEKQRKEPVARLLTNLKLGGQNFDLIFSDEQAKANLNAIWERRGRGGAEMAARRLMGTSNLRVALAPRLSKNPNAIPLESLGQIFAKSSAKQWITTDERSPAPIDQLTCWGSGTLNFRRAPLGAIQQACLPALSLAQSQRLEALRRRSPELSLDAMLDQLELPIEHRQRAKTWLAETSSCHSLWIIAGTKDRNYYELAVLDQSDSNEPKIFCFTW